MQNKSVVPRDVIINAIMSEETKSFRCQLEEIREHLEKCKLERVKRHSEFTRRVDDIKARHERLTSGRLRRLSIEGIIVDIDSIRSHNRNNVLNGSEAKEERGNCFTPCVRRQKSESSIMLCKASEKLSAEKCCPSLSGGINVEEEQPYKKLHFELAFDSKISGNLNLKKTSKLKYGNKWRITRNKSTANLKAGMNDQTQNKSKFQSAYSKVLRDQKFMPQRRHTILSMAPIDIGEKSRLPSAVVCDQNSSQPQRQNSVTIDSQNMTNQRNVSIKQTSFEYHRRGFKEQSRH